MRCTLVGLLLAACTPQAPPANPAAAALTPDVRSPAQPEAGSKPFAAPVAIDAVVGATRSKVTVTFERPGSGVVVEIWGASGLTVQADKVVFAGEVADPHVETFTVDHTGSGDLAVRVEGEYQGSRLDRVQSFTVGERQPTAVPTQPTEDGKRLKGWEGTAP